MDENAVKDIKYNQAMSELEKILAEMQNENCDIDKLVAYTKRATELIKACRSKLTATEEELREALSELKNG